MVKLYGARLNVATATNCAGSPVSAAPERIGGTLHGRSHPGAAGL